MAGRALEKRTPIEEALAHVASDAFLAKLENALPEGITVRRFASVAVAAIKGAPELITADRESLYNSIVRCAQDGLMPDSKEAALVIYKVKGRDVVRYMPMIGGYRKIAAKHGITIVADVVRAGDQFDYSKVPPALTHKPAPLGQERGEIVGAYAVAYRDGRLVAAPEVMEPDEIEKVRAVSRAAKSEYGPWVNWWDRMAAKTVARRLFGQLPLADVDDQTRSVIAASDEEFEFPDRPQMTEGQANAIATASTVGEPIGDQKLREEPQPEGPSDAQLNRIAELLKTVDERYARATLRGVFGVDDPAQLSPEEADRYEQTLREFVTPRDGAEDTADAPDTGAPAAPEPAPASVPGDGDEQAGAGEGTEPAPAPREAEQRSFEELVPPEVKKQQQRRRRSS